MGFSFKELFSLKELSFFKKKGSVLGVDIGSSGIKVVQLRKEKERAILETYGEIAVGPYANLGVGQSAKLSEEKVVEVLKDVLREANVKSKNASVSIALKSSFVTIIDIPVVNGKNISEIIELEARRYIPLSVSEVKMDWWILPEVVERSMNNGSDDGNNKRKFAKVLLVAIHKDIISKYKEIISMAGLDISSFEIESFSMIRASTKRETSPVAVMDFGASSIKMSIVDFGIMMASHSITKGSQDLSIAISHSLGVDFNRAEEMKREVGLSDLPEHKEIVSIIEPMLGYIFSEAETIIKNYQKKRGRSINRVILTGGGSLLKGLVPFAVKQLAIEAELSNPFSRTEYPAFLNESLKESGPIFSVAIGLALRGLQ